MKEEIDKLPSEYSTIWDKCLGFLKEGRPGDISHAKSVVESVLNYVGGINFDSRVIIPVAMMHDIGHASILPEHFCYITGPDKIINGKLVHMLSGAKIAKGILLDVDYNPNLIDEIIEIISIHDADQLSGINLEKIYNTENKRFFHDVDSLDRYNIRRLNDVSEIYTNRSELLFKLEKFLSSFFFDEFREAARENLKKLA